MRSLRAARAGVPTTSVEEVLIAKDGEIEALRESNRMLQRSAVGNRDGRHAAEAKIEYLRAALSDLLALAESHALDAAASDDEFPVIVAARRALNGDADA